VQPREVITAQFATIQSSTRFIKLDLEILLYDSRMPSHTVPFLSARSGITACILFGWAGSAWAQPVLITAPTTIGPHDATIIPTAGGDPVPLPTAMLTVRGTTLTLSGQHVIASLSLEQGASLTHPAGALIDYSNNGTSIVRGMDLGIVGDCVIDATSRLDVSGQGFPGSNGPGSGMSGSGPCGGGGGGHGGSGGTANCSNIQGGPANGSSTTPTSFGSGGGGYPGVTPGGAGGGVARLYVLGTLSLSGSILADGTAPLNASGGAGGSLWISAYAVLGTGTIRAAGATEATTNDSSGGGGGGRIALTDYCVLDPAIALFVPGGDGPRSEQIGASGTIHLAPRQSGCCRADVNADGFLDFFDYDAFVLAFEGGGGVDPDFNRDGFVDFFDYNDFVAAFEAGC
jgi:hypothetical protein